MSAGRPSVCSLPLCKFPAIVTLYDRLGQPFGFCSGHVPQYAATQDRPGYTAKP